MSDQDPGRIWRDQPEEPLPVTFNNVMERRARELSSGTRAEILMSLVAVLLLVAVTAWRLRIGRDGLLEVGLAAAVAWVAVSLYRFRRRIWRRDELAVTGVEHYRAELERRRDHLRNTWIWHGPLFLAAVILMAVFIGRSNVLFRTLRSALPLLVLLAAWTIFSARRRLRQARDLDREIEQAVAVCRQPDRARIGDR